MAAGIFVALALALDPEVGARVGGANAVAIVAIAGFDRVNVVGQIHQLADLVIVQEQYHFVVYLTPRPPLRIIGEGELTWA